VVSRPRQVARRDKPLSSIVDETGLGWRTVAKWVTLGILPERRLMDPRPSNPARFQDFLARLWDMGCTNGRKVLIEVQKQGYTGSFSHLERLLRKWRCTGAVAVPVQEPATVELPAVTAIPSVPPIAASHPLHEATWATDATGGGGGWTD
jgi:hypothetical protein